MTWRNVLKIWAQATAAGMVQFESNRKLNSGVKTVFHDGQSLEWVVNIGDCPLRHHCFGQYCIIGTTRSADSPTAH
jgi:hypothetical protein